MTKFSQHLDLKQYARLYYDLAMAIATCPRTGPHRPVTFCSLGMQEGLIGVRG